MRCPDCNKFVSLETQDPEADSLEVAESINDGNVNVTGTVRLVRTCGDCGTEMKETSLDIDQDIEIEAWKTGDKLTDLEISESGIESTETGGGRYQKNMIGFKLEVEVTGKIIRGKKEIEFTQSSTLEDATPASSFDEMA